MKYNIYEHIYETPTIIGSRIFHCMTVRRKKKNLTEPTFFSYGELSYSEKFNYYNNYYMKSNTIPVLQLFTSRWREPRPTATAAVGDVLLERQEGQLSLC